MWYTVITPLMPGTGLAAWGRGMHVRALPASIVVAASSGTTEVLNEYKTINKDAREILMELFRLLGCSTHLALLHLHYI
ncbi:hypothetical protein PSPO01_03756 [Paraphaeosphaeria sporulosa]